ncbi:hypothetical protein OG321_42005 [Streptomyces sp. NBC_00424]|uniref:hypothetical protein n=1 Tax=Streptomyces sp. NBC_00424 TaxID=2903648 RepID=UPI00224D310A|nr:hypothetical protein [Streptomyces sp. NBC_00424]MCX5078979.1 hypothetical protein [Streptomyces sp. NBC_00424]
MAPATTPQHLGGKVYHTLRQGNRNWLAWGHVAGAAGSTGPITSISTVGSGDETHIVIATDNGSRQYHAARTSTAPGPR